MTTSTTKTRKIAKSQCILTHDGKWMVTAEDWNGRLHFHSRRDLTAAAAQKLMLKVREAGRIDLEHWMSRAQGNLAA
jgi:hypothetical protein